MWEAINSFLTKVDDFVWGPPLMILIIAGGILLTIRMGVLQVRKLPLALKWMVKNEEEGEGEVTSFGALCTALSATIGTGNIIGISSAIALGGPGCRNSNRSRWPGCPVLDGACCILRNGNQVCRGTPCS